MATSTITGRVIDITGTNRACAIVFTPTSTPIASSPSLITSFVRTIYSAEDGTFSLTLTEGDYTVTFAGTDSLTISVPETAGTYDLLTLITSEVVWNPSTVGNFALLKGNNLSDLTNVATARTNLSVYSIAAVDAIVAARLLKTANLSDLSSISTARANLDVYSTEEVDALVAGGGFIGTANRAVVTNGSGALASSAVTATEVGYLAGVTSLIQTQLDARELAANKGQINGYASLDSGGKIPSAQIPNIALTEPFVVASQAAMLALTAQIGDFAIRTDVGKSFVLSTNSPSTLADWKELVSTGTITSVNGMAGPTVTLAGSNILLTGYSIGASTAAIVGTDTVSQAFGKLELGKLSLSGGAMTGDFRVLSALYFYNVTPGVDEGNLGWSGVEFAFSHKVTGPEFFFGGGTIDDALSVSGNISAGHYIMPDAIEVSGTDVDGATGSVFRKEVSENADINLLNIKNGQTVVLEVSMNSAGPYSITWTYPGANLVWPGGITPSPTTGIGGGTFISDVYAFVRVGGNIFGSVVQNYTY